MAGEVLQLAPQRAEHRTEVFVSRQPVVDSEMRVTGYRIAYATPDRYAVPEREDGPRDPSSLRLFGDVLSVVGLQELVGWSLAHLPVSRELLLTLGVAEAAMVRIACP